MKKIENFVNLYPVSKTIRFKLIPQGRTEEFFNSRLMLKTDEKRAEEYKTVKKYIDEYHKDFIDRVLLDNFHLEGINDYAQIYFKSQRTADDNNALESIAAGMRKHISDAFTKQHKREYDGLFKSEMIREYLPAFLKDDDKSIVADFNNFTTYFVGFHENRKNMYSGEGKSTEIAFRIVNQNLPKFLDNCKTGEKVMSLLPKQEVSTLQKDISSVFGINIETIFDIKSFDYFLSQTGIDLYNQVIGGYTKESDVKVKGFNEYINEYCQKHNEKIPKLKPLFKQILSDRTTYSFIPETFSSDHEVLKAINDAYIGKGENGLSVAEVIKRIKSLLCSVQKYDMRGVYICAGSGISDISQKMLGEWSIIQNGLNMQYEIMFPVPKRGITEKYIEDRKKYFRGIKSYSINDLQLAVASAYDKEKDTRLSSFISKEAEMLAGNIETCYSLAKSLLVQEYPKDRNLQNDDASIQLIKNFLDSLKEFKRYAELFMGSGTESDKDELFYGEYAVLAESLEPLNKLYDKVRNYITRKPYSTDKIKLNFDNPQLLGGWDANKEKDYLSVLLRKDNYYYLAIMSAKSRKVFEQAPAAKEGEPAFQKMIYKLLPGPNKMLPKVFFSKTGQETFDPPADIIEKYKQKTHIKGDNFIIDDCHGLIDFFKQGINKHKDWSRFDFTFSETASYSDISQFYKEVKDQGYKVTFKDIPEKYVNDAVENGEVYLFQIYNKDFSEFSKGTPNLHTLYFNMLFNEENLADVVFALNGGAEMFYRKASIKEKDIIKHPSEQKISNKNPYNKKKESLFAYDIIKDRRFTKRQFMLHIPITINFKSNGISSSDMNFMVRKAVKDCEHNYVIGIDRGERNLIYISVIDNKGRIVEQKSMNLIESDRQSGKSITDYHAKLDEIQASRDNQRKNWKVIESIKGVKEGYISQIIHVICEMVEKYDAIIAMEDLNTGFKNSRVKVEKQVYQKFEKMLIDKLNLYINKKAPIHESGGLLKAYQLTNKFESFAKMGKQNGIIFYVPAWLTSKIDPVTGFSDLIKPRFESIDKSLELIEKIDDIRYNPELDWFEFDIDYAKFPRGAVDFTKKWTVVTNGKRIRTFRNPEKNNNWDNMETELTDCFKRLFDEYGMDIGNNIKPQIMQCREKRFLGSFIHLLALTLQMRNSITGTEVDYLISPIRNASGKCFSTNGLLPDSGLPIDADANGAYNIARKALWIIDQIKKTNDNLLRKLKISISNAEWLEYVQSPDRWKI